MDVDLQSLGPTSVGAFEAVLAFVSAALYLLVALAVLAKASRDQRSRLFLLIAMTNVMPYVASVLFWYRGAVNFTKPLLLAVALSFAVGSVALFHFSQLFPWRRPWIREQTPWLKAAYLACPLLTLAVILPMPPDLIDMTQFDALLLLVAGFPTMVLIGLVLPFGGLLSLYKSYQAAKRNGVESARATLLGILVSQLGGGVLSVIVIPFLHIVVPEGPWLTIASSALLAFGVVMPIAFWMGVWRYRVLELDIERLPG
jgi:hypothetical protein